MNWTGSSILFKGAILQRVAYATRYLTAWLVFREEPLAIFREISKRATRFDLSSVVFEAV
jgi:hypothetical protein